MDNLTNEFIKLNESYKFYCDKMADLNGLTLKNHSITINSALFRMDIEDSEIRDEILKLVRIYLNRKITEIQKELSTFKLTKK